MVYIFTDWDGAALRRARKQARLTQQQLADLVGMQQPHICDLERNRRTPSYENLRMIAKALGLELMIGEDPSRAPLGVVTVGDLTPTPGLPEGPKQVSG